MRSFLNAGLKQIAMPKTIQPMQPTLYRRAVSSRKWLFEPKWDGFRAICFLEKEVVRFVSRILILNKGNC